MTAPTLPGTGHEAQPPAPSAAKPPTRRSPIGDRPTADAVSSWVHQADSPSALPSAAPKATVYTARLTVDVTPELRGRIKVVAFQRGVTAAHLVRTLLEREFAEGQP